MTTTPGGISDDKLLAMPAGNLAPLWSVRSNILHDREIAELAREKAGLGRPLMLFDWTTPREKKLLEDKRQRDRVEYEQRMRDLAQRQDRLLVRIEAEQTVIAKEQREIRENALRLHDGRTVWTDGDRYRDDNGNLLMGRDEAEAARQHEVRPDAPTWAQKQALDQQAEALKHLQNEVEADRAATAADAPGAGERDRIGAEEKSYSDLVEARAAPPPADYGSSDYMSEYALSSRPAFTDAANGGSGEATPANKKTDGDTAQLKKTPPPSAMGMKVT